MNIGNLDLVEYAIPIGCVIVYVLLCIVLLMMVKGAIKDIDEVIKKKDDRVKEELTMLYQREQERFNNKLSVTTKMTNEIKELKAQDSEENHKLLIDKSKELSSIVDEMREINENIDYILARLKNIDSNLESQEGV